MEYGYAICLNEWVLDQDIKNELGLLLIISSLCAEKGHCYASNQYLAQIFKVDEATISRKIKKLEVKKYITIGYQMRGTQVVSRLIRLTKMSSVQLQKCQPTIDENVKENITSINNTSKKKEIYKERKTFASIINDYTPNEELREALSDYVEMRAKDKKFTLRALELNLNALLKMSDSPREQIEIINQSISNSWKAFYPLRVQEERRARPAEVIEDYTASNNPKIDDETKKRLRERRNGNK